MRRASSTRPTSSAGRLRELGQAAHVRVRTKHRDHPHHLDGQRATRSRAWPADGVPPCAGRARGPAPRPGRGSDAALADLAHELAHEKRVALCCGEARSDEGLVGVVARLFPQQRLERGSAERTRPHEPCARMAEQRSEQMFLHVVVAGAARNHECHREVLHATGEVGQEGERGGIRPMGVVDQHEQRRALRQAGAEPVEPVQDRERALVLLAPAP